MWVNRYAAVCDIDSISSPAWIFLTTHPGLRSLKPSVSRNPKRILWKCGDSLHPSSPCLQGWNTSAPARAPDSCSSDVTCLLMGSKPSIVCIDSFEYSCSGDTTQWPS